MKIVIVGQAPSKRGDPERPCEGLIGKRIALLAGVSLEEYLKRTERLNVVPRWCGKSGLDGSADAFPVKQARKNADEIASRLARRNSNPPRVVLLGRLTGEAFGMRGEYFSWSGRFVVVPHPSGLNRWYNSPENYQRVERFFAELFS